MVARGISSMNDNGTARFTTTCPWCLQPVAVDQLSIEALDAYLAGRLSAATLFPDLSASEREVLVSGTHAKCWEEMWPQDDDAPAGAPCGVCGEPSRAECAACDIPLCEEHARTTSVPGDTFCQTGVGCCQDRR
jgi:hypothetical protein